MLDMRKEFKIGDFKQLSISKFEANVGNIFNFEKNSVHILVVFWKRELLFL